MNYLIRKLISKMFPSNIKLLRLRGVRIGENNKIFNTEINFGHEYLIKIGDSNVITNATLIAHDASTKYALGYSKIGKVCVK